MHVKDHYDKHLAKYYTWMSGDFNAMQEKMSAFFNNNNLAPRHPGHSIAIDLGAGAGIQSLALASLGYSVKAIDFSEVLIAELKKHIKNEDVQVVEADILDFKAYAGYAPELMICMGDTLTHLQDQASVSKLINNSATLLGNGGKLILQFRDLNFELQGTDRFIPVKLTEDRIFTCYLEYMPDYVMVHDIVYEKENGQWAQKISQYQKLKLSAHQVENMLLENGFTVNSLPPERGMITLIAEKK